MRNRLNPAGPFVMECAKHTVCLWEAQLSGQYTSKAIRKHCANLLVEPTGLMQRLRKQRTGSLSLIINGD